MNPAEVYCNGLRMVEGYVEPDEGHRGRYALAAATIPPTVPVIDWGCGSGYGSAYFSGRPYIGVEADEIAVAWARQKYGAAFLRANILTADITAAWGMCFEVVEHIAGSTPSDTVRLLLARTPSLIVSFPQGEMPGTNQHHVHHLLRPEDVFGGLTWEATAAFNTFIVRPEGAA